MISRDYRTRPPVCTVVCNSCYRAGGIPPVDNSDNAQIPGGWITDSGGYHFCSAHCQEVFCKAGELREKLRDVIVGIKNSEELEKLFKDYEKKLDELERS